MIKEDLTKEVLISGTGIKYHFDIERYLKAITFIMKKFNLSLTEAKGQLNYYIVKDGGKFGTSKRCVNARLNNIIELDYKWYELFN